MVNGYAANNFAAAVIKSSSFKFHIVALLTSCVSLLKEEVDKVILLMA